MNNAATLLGVYFRQQVELGAPDAIFSSPTLISDALRKRRQPARESAPGPVKHAVSISDTRPEKDSTPQPSTAASQFSQSNPQRRQLVDVYKQHYRCQNCALGKTRTKFVFGAGSADAPLMIIGEAPGADEDREGVPFVGPAGRLLTKMLAAIDLDRDKDVFITNILKCRPPRNRDPQDAEIVACNPILKQQLAVIKPLSLLLLGRIAAQTLLQTTASISRMRGQIHEYESIPAFVTYHPAALLRNQSLKRPAWEDLQKLQKFLKERNVYAAP
ncbi:MAG: uracil-DNA glycosylase [Chitinivibrionales bacterium]|nr:uracil-DNA glycosylase [Chitinivibrionales bacterium]